MPCSQCMLFCRGVMRVQGRWKQDRDWWLGKGRWRAGWGLVVMMMVVVLMVVVVNGRPVMWDDGRGGGEDVGSWGRSWWGRVAPGHAWVGWGSSTGEGGGGRAGQAVGQGLIVEEVRALVDEALDDCLVCAGGGQGVHGGEVWSHQRRPEADWQILTGHQVQLVVLTHPEEQNISAFFFSPEMYFLKIFKVCLVFLKVCR